ALLSKTDSEAALCSQLLRFVCSASDLGGSIDAEAFGQGVAQWVGHCIETVENTEGATQQYGDSETINIRISTALTETIWALSIEWEPDTAEESDERWDDEKLCRLERNRQLIAITKGLLSADVISQDLAKERLDADFLEQVGAIPLATVFTRKCIRLNTTMNFKQTKFNLISEQNEGFAKLVVLIQGAMAAVAPHQLSSEVLSAIDGAAALDTVGGGSVVIRALRSLSSLQRRVKLLLGDIMRLIGVFNIDPNRAVDIIIDCFMSSVRFYWPFYIALLDASPWTRGATESLKVAQLVGWKMQFYASEPTTAFKFMDELTTIAVLLIAHGLIQLGDLYPMLTPARNEDMVSEFDTWSASLKEARAKSSANQLAEMGGLEDMGDGGMPSEATPMVKADIPGERVNQHALLCAKLLSIGDTTNALVYLTRFPNLARVHQPIADMAVRIVDVATTELYQNTDCVRAPIKPYLRLTSNAAVADIEPAAMDMWGIPRQPLQSQCAADGRAARKSYVLSPPDRDSSEAFFYEDFWLLEAAERLPKARSIASLPRELAPWLNVAFTRLHQSSALLMRLMRLCRYGLRQQPDEEHTWLGFLRSWLLPAYSFAVPSAGLSNELWLIISMLPLAKRYGLYRDWHGVLTSGCPVLPRTATGDTDEPNSLDMAMSLDDVLEDADCAPVQSTYVEVEALSLDVRRQVRSMMRRLSGDTVKLVGRQICTLCHATPTLALKIVLDQVCSYDNLIDSVVKAFRYLTPLDVDVMFYVILSTLDDPASSPVKDDGINAAHWLQSLSMFVAAFSHRHESPGLAYVLGYVLKQIVRMVATEDAPPVFETTLISEAILRLAAIDVMANATDDQILALQGGYYLNLEAFSMVSPLVLPQEATIDDVLTACTDTRLTRRLAQWVTGLVVSNDQALPLAVAMSIHADKILKMSSLPLSSTLIIYDRELERVYQLFNLLYMNLKPERYAKVIPGPHTLASQYGLSWALAILWGRPNVAFRLAQSLKQWESDGEPINVKIVESDASHDTQLSKLDEAAVKAALDVNTETDQAKANMGSAGAGKDLADTPMDSADTSMEQSDVGIQKTDASSADIKTPNTDSAIETATAASDSESKMDVDSKNDKDEVPRVIADLQFESPLLPREYVAYIAQTLPSSAIDIGLSPEFVAVFWTLSLYDIEVPSGRYEKEIEVYTQFIARIDGMAKTVHGSHSKATGLAQARARASASIEALNKEMLEQKQHVMRIRRWLIAQKDYWFCMAHEQRKLVTQALLQHCVLPRAVLSAADANFCAKFLWIMHYPLATNKFSLMIVYDSVFSESLSTLLAAFTENEARNYAKFLSTSLAYLSHLHLSKTHYAERAVNAWRGLTGFQQQWRYDRGFLPPRSRTILSPSPPEGSGDERRIKPGTTMLSYEDFRTVMRKWQVNLTKAFIVTLESERHDTVRNSILALKEMRKSFPVILQYGRRIMDKVNEVAAGRTSGQGQSGSTNNLDSDKNLKVLAASYSAFLGSAKQTWIPESKYYSMPVRATPTRSSHPAPAQPPTRQVSRDSVASDSATKGDAQPRADSSQRIRQRPGPSRSGSGNQAVAAVAAVTAAAAGASRALSGGSSGSGHASTKTSTRPSALQRQSRNEGMTRNGASESGRDHDQDRAQERNGSWSRSRDRQHDHQNEPEFVSREDRLRRDSPARNDRSDEQSGAHTPKRSRDELPGSSTLEPPRQRLATPSAVESRTKSPAEAGSMPAAKMSSEEVDRKRKELRAQLLKQQEKKKQEENIQPQLASETPSERRDRSGRGAGGRQGQEDARQRDQNIQRGRQGQDGGRQGRDGGRQHGQKTQGGRQSQEDTRQRDQTIQGGRRAKHGDHPIAGPQADQRSHSERGIHRPNWVNSASGPGTQQGLQGGRHTLPEDTLFNRNSGGRQNRQDSGKPGPAGRKGQGDGGRRGPKRGRGAEARDWDDGKRHRR
ncbi:THO2 plays a role in transcriptional elongation, partial [Coemansia sp. RSA 720]